MLTVVEDIADKEFDYVICGQSFHAVRLRRVLTVLFKAAVYVGAIIAS
jgi:hypothetical protein